MYFLITLVMYVFPYLFLNVVPLFLCLFSSFFISLFIYFISYSVLHC